MPRGIRNFAIFVIAMLASWIVGANVSPTWTVEKVELDVKTDSDGKLYYIYREKPAYFEAVADGASPARSGQNTRVEYCAVDHGRICLGGGDRPLLQTGGQAPLELLVAAAGGGGRACCVG